MVALHFTIVTFPTNARLHFMKKRPEFAPIKLGAAAKTENPGERRGSRGFEDLGEDSTRSRRKELLSTSATMAEKIQEGITCMVPAAIVSTRPSYRNPPRACSPCVRSMLREENTSLALSP